MSKCIKCGADCDDALGVCTVCGAAVGKNAGASESMPTQERLMAIFSYLGLLFLIPLVADKGSMYVRYHVNQGLVLFICEVLTAALSAVLWYLPGIGWILSLSIGLPLYLVTVAFMVVGIIHSVNGDERGLPLIGRLQLIK